MKNIYTANKNGYEIKIIVEGDIVETRIAGYIDDETITTAVICNKKPKITSSKHRKGRGCMLSY